MSSWKLDDGISAAQSLEEIAISFDLHICLGGSVLHKGSSDKDIDIFVYPHDTNHLNSIDNYNDFLNHLIKLGYVVTNPTKDNKYKPAKNLVIMTYQNKRYDFFFVK